MRKILHQFRVEIVEVEPGTSCAARICVDDVIILETIEQSNTPDALRALGEHFEAEATKILWAVGKKRPM